MENNEEIFDYIVIGSGFGGAVSAMRLSEKGYKVLVIEKGKTYHSSDFPQTNWSFKKYFWLPALRWFGIQKLSLFREVFILSGVGVGGGSLVYANTHMFPPDEFFQNPVWADIKDWKKTLTPFYDKARFMLGTVPNTSFDRADQVLKELAIEMGRESSYKGVDVGVYFGDTETETDPYFKGLGPQRKGCTQCAGCMVGCRHNAKNTLDKNYLFFAQKNGTQLLDETLAVKVEFDGTYYHIYTRSSTSFFNKKKKTYKSKGIVISGGVLGTMDLLLKQKHKYKTLPRLSNKLGENIRTNSESLLGVTSSKEKLNHGLAITSVFNPDDHTHIEVVKYPDRSNGMKLFATLAAGPGHPVIRAFRLMGNIITHPIQYIRMLVDGKWAEKSVIFLVMQTLDSSMRMVYKRFPLSGISMKNKKENRVPAYIDIGQKVMYAYAKKVNGIPQNALTEVLFNIPSTAHILGGCPMGLNENEGVVNDRMQAFGYPEFYVLDGSIVPCNIGVNPSLTITALSEYAMSFIPEKQGNIIRPIEEELSLKV
ncbi:MAG: GMC family oxidoreductase [Candidatus Competibacteraceae bacterium]|nr:GMC family oxidoreductase [Candidatus Competibacteraceae bacterium]